MLSFEIGQTKKTLMFFFLSFSLRPPSPFLTTFLFFFFSRSLWIKKQKQKNRPDGNIEFGYSLSRGRRPAMEDYHVAAVSFFESFFLIFKVAERKKKKAKKGPFFLFS